MRYLALSESLSFERLMVPLIIAIKMPVQMPPANKSSKSMLRLFSISRGSALDNVKTTAMIGAIMALRFF